MEFVVIEIFEQGSQYMNTAVKPVKKVDDYDIDIGLLLDANHKNITAVEAKRQVKDLLEKGKRKVISKKPCIRINYSNFHVDLAIYSESLDEYDTYKLARGYERGTKSEQKWENAQPKHLQEWFENSFTEAKDKEQIKRIIRILKRWKDVNFKNEKERPTGIAITVCVCNWFNTFQGQQNDVNSLLELLYIIRKEIFPILMFGKIKLNLSVKPYNNLFDKMNTDVNFVNNFRRQLDILILTLEQASTSRNEIAACLLLRKVFGKDFPVLKGLLN